MEKLNYYQKKIITFSLLECLLQAMMVFKICLFTNQNLIHKSLKKTAALVALLAGNQGKYIHLNVHHYILLSCLHSPQLRFSSRARQLRNQKL